MRDKIIDQKISNLGYLLLTENSLFETTAKEESLFLEKADLSYLKSKFHNPPPVHADIKESELRLGQWMAVCQYSIFELFYNMYPYSLSIIKEVAFGEYDWTQATALELLCRLYIEKKVSEETITEINSEMNEMRYETHLYLGRSLLIRQKHDHRFKDLLSKLDNQSFQEALEELSE